MNKHLKNIGLGLCVMFVFTCILAAALFIMLALCFIVKHAGLLALKIAIITAAVLALAWLIGWDANR